MEEIIKGSYFFTRPLTHHLQRSCYNFLNIKEKKDIFDNNVPNLEEDIKDIKNIKNLNVYIPEFKNLRRLNFYQQNLSAAQDYRKFRRSRNTKKKRRKVLYKHRFGIKERTGQFVRGPYYNYWFRRMGYTFFFSVFFAIIGLMLYFQLTRALVHLNMQMASA